MADTKVSALTAATSCAATDVFYLTADPGGTPLSRKIEVDDVFKRGTLTTDVKVIDASVTWNEGATTFTGFKLNVTDTASAAASKLLDLQVGGSSIAGITKAARMTLANGLHKTYVGFDGTSSDITHEYNSQERTKFSLYGLNMNSSALISWSNSTTGHLTTRDLYLYRDAAGTLALRNSTNPQTLRVYNTGDSTNGEWGYMRFSSNVFEIGATKAGTGTERPLSITATSVRMATLPTSDPTVANQLFTQTATELGGSGTTKVLCVSAG